MMTGRATLAAGVQRGPYFTSDQWPAYLGRDVR